MHWATTNLANIITDGTNMGICKSSVASCKTHQLSGQFRSFVSRILDRGNVYNTAGLYAASSLRRGPCVFLSCVLWERSGLN